MDFEKFSDRLKGFVQSAQTLAIREGNPQITPEHLLKVLLDDPEGLASGLITKAGGRPKEALERTEAIETTSRRTQDRSQSPAPSLRGGFVNRVFKLTFAKRSLTLSTYAEPGEHGRWEQFLIGE